MSCIAVQMQVPAAVLGGTRWWLVAVARWHSRSVDAGAIDVQRGGFRRGSRRRGCD